MTQPRKATWPATLLKRNGREVPFDKHIMLWRN